MNGVDHCRLMARYNRWMNERMYARAAELDDAARKLDRGLYFGSIHRTLNHVVWADRTWLSRIEGTAFAEPAYGADLYGDFAGLAREREAADLAILSLCGRMTDARLAETLEYRNTAGQARRAPLWIVLTHLFNHQAHHRGQALTGLTLAGKDIGPTDLIALPGVVESRD